MYYTIFLTILLIVSAGGGERAGRARRGGFGGGRERDRCLRDQERRQGPQETESVCFGTRSPCRQAGERAGCFEVITLYISADPQMWDR